MCRLDYFLPRYESPICTAFFMTEAYEQKLYLPLQSAVNPCVRRTCPNNEDLRAELIAAVEVNLQTEYGPRLYELRRHLQCSDPADKNWSMAMLRHFNAEHRFFKKNFEPKKKKAGVNEEDEAERQEKN